MRMYVSFGFEKQREFSVVGLFFGEAQSSAHCVLALDLEALFEWVSD